HTYRQLPDLPSFPTRRSSDLAHLTFQVWPWLSKETRTSLGGQFIMPYVGIKHVPLIFSGNISYAEIKEKYLEQIYSGSVGINYRSEEHTSELQSQSNLVCRLL